MQHDKDASWTGQTLAQYQSTVRLFSSLVGESRPIAQIDAEIANGFLEKLAHLHPNWGKHRNASALSLEELLKSFPGKLSNKTINRHHLAMRGLFDWAIGKQWYPKENGNPFGFKLRVKGERRKMPFTVDMLNALLERPNSRPAKHGWLSSRPWFTLIALFSGMRQDEIGALHVSDIITIDGVDFFNVTDAKTSAGIRRVPIHSRILGYGFLDYVRFVGSGTLWPGLKPGGKAKSRGHVVAKRYPEYRRKVGAYGPHPLNKDSQQGRDDFDFHSFRRCVVSEFTRQRVHLNEYAEIIGHERGFTRSHYAPLPLEPVHAKLLIEKLDYPGVNLR